MSDLLPDLEQGQPASALLSILNQAGARRVLSQAPVDHGLAEHLPYPFLAIVKQIEMRTALLLAVINPAIGGVLLIGPRGTGKTTAVRSLTGVLPRVPVLSEDGQETEQFETVKLIELPLNARLEDVVGGVNERIAVQQGRVRLERGILSRADQNLLYVDEVNLLDDVIVDAILDAAAQGSYTVRRGAVAGTYRSRFVLVGSMNPEEGRLRPQIMDRFGLRVVVRGLTDPEDRMLIYNRVRQYRLNPRAFIQEWAEHTVAAREEVAIARELLKEVSITDEAQKAGLHLIERLNLDSHRAELTLFEAARAHAAADGRIEAIPRDIHAVASLSLRQRRSQFMIDFFDRQQEEDELIENHLEEIIGKHEHD